MPCLHEIGQAPARACNAGPQRTVSRSCCLSARCTCARDSAQETLPDVTGILDAGCRARHKGRAPAAEQGGERLDALDGRCGQGQDSHCAIAGGRGRLGPALDHSELLHDIWQACFQMHSRSQEHASLQRLWRVLHVCQRHTVLFHSTSWVQSTEHMGCCKADPVSPY